MVSLDGRGPVSLDALKQMCGVLVHRGPDDEGFYVDGNVGLGMRRLSVIDISGGHQPISNEDGSIWVVFNGEIYNFPELRRELESRGHEFATNTDTETIVHAYEEYGVDCVSRFNGMFGFAIWDGRDRKLVLARDRVGIKPLYYYLDSHCIVFASELKAILQLKQVPRELDYAALDTFLTFEYVPAPLSIFQGVRKLLPGHVLVLQDGAVSIRKYWDIEPRPPHDSEEELPHDLYELLKDAVRARLISDVPLGAFLSGGLDSSTIVCLMSELMDRPVKTFSIGFDDPSYNELGYARAVAGHFGTDHQELVIQPNVVELVESLVGYLDEPFADVSAFPTYLVSQLARQSVTVALSGDGGDELFAGYDWYVAGKVERYYRRLPRALRNSVIPGLLGRISPSARKRGLVNNLKRFAEGAALPRSARHFRWATFLAQPTKADLFTEELKSHVDGHDPYAGFVDYLDLFEEADSLWREQFADVKTYLPDDILVKLDRMSMANSLEARTPFLDHRVVEFAASVPSHLKLRGFTRKYLLKRAMASRLPGQVLTRRKEGFSIPMKNWLRQELRPLMEEVLSPQRLGAAGLFNPACVQTLKDQHQEGVANRSHLLWSLMMFEMWRETYLKG